MLDQTTPIPRSEGPPDPERKRRGRLGRAALLLLVLVLVSLTTAGSAHAQREADPGVDPEPLVDAPAAGRELTPAKAVVLGLVEGITEYLPISSTGHLLVAQDLMDIGQTDETEDAANSYAIAIQAGAILAVLILYWRRLTTMASGLVGRSEEGRRVLVGLVIACIPAGLTALVFEDSIKSNLLGAWPVVAAWAVGGVAILVLEPRLRREAGATPLESIRPGQALLIGLAQIVALWPGTSRSLMTILAALAVGLALDAAVEFSFLLGLATLGAATVYEMASNGSAMIETYGWVSPLIGLVVSFASAAIAVKWLVTYLRKHSLAIFGWYRIGMAAVVGALVLTGAI